MLVGRAILWLFFSFDFVEFAWVGVAFTNVGKLDVIYLLAVCFSCAVFYGALSLYLLKNFGLYNLLRG